MARSNRRPGDEIRELSWAATDPVEAFRRSELMQRFSEAHFSIPERLRFHIVIVGESGEGDHEIDFALEPIRPRRVLHLEPGQVQRWSTAPDFDAFVVLFPEAPAGLDVGWRLGSPGRDLDDEQWRDLRRLVRLIQQEGRSDREPAARRIALRALRDLVFVRLGLGWQSGRRREDLPEAYVAFRDDLEADLSVATTVGERASRLGFSARTISRACLEVTGRTAKALSDERIVLEARRLLAQPNASVGTVALALGFTEQTNLSKYFRRHTGETPSDWIEGLRVAG